MGLYIKKGENMLTIDIKEAEANFEKYVKLLEDKKEKEIIISINGNPTMVLLPYTKQRKRVFGSAKGKISVPDDFDDIDIFKNAQKWARKVGYKKSDVNTIIKNYRKKK